MSISVTRVASAGVGKLREGRWSAAGPTRATGSLRVSSNVVAAVEQAGKWRQISLQGEVDMATARHLEAAVARELDDGSDWLLVDMRRVTFVDSTGVTALFRAHEEAEGRGGALRVVAGPGPVRRVLSVSGIDQLVAVFDDPAQARAD